MTPSGSIQGIKLMTGEELVAEVEFVDPRGVVTVKNPLLLRMSMGKEGMVCNFFPWTIIAEGGIHIEGHGILARYDVPGDVEKGYYQNTSGLQIVSAMPPQILQG